MELDSFGVINNAVYQNYFEHTPPSVFGITGPEIDCLS
jgi:acyl-CoA thioesterase FadM